ncbi:MAG: methyltransferase [Candidatus Hydrogenedentales bacterium]|jgi:SAM-dependent methyltransferase
MDPQDATAIREYGNALNALSNGFIHSQILFTAHRANAFAQLEEPRTAEEVARILGLDPRATRMLLDGLLALKLVEKSHGRYSNGPAATACLVPGKPHYQGHILEHNANYWDICPKLIDAVRTGEPVRGPGASRTPEELRAFILGMRDIGAMSAQEMLRAMDLSRYRHVLDVGGGPATYSIAFLKAHPEMRATEFDRPEVIEIAREQVAEAGVAGRFSFLPGDIATDAFGSGYDLVLVSNIIHSFSPDGNRAMVRKCYDALDSGGTLIIKDFLVDNDRSGPAFSLIFALRMLLATGEGDTYTFDEVASWTKEAGFGKGEIVDLTPQTRLWVVTKG